MSSASPKNPQIEATIKITAMGKSNDLLQIDMPAHVKTVANQKQTPPAVGVFAL
jgi:hypothetical protein